MHTSLAAGNTINTKQSFLNHIEQAKLVSKQVHSKHLCGMIGCVTLYDPLCLVMELPSNGDLLTYLISCRQEVRSRKN